jgi:hypothetical protein
MKTAAMRMMMAGPRTVGLGYFSPVQRLDEQSEASVYKSPGMEEIPGTRMP